MIGIRIWITDPDPQQVLNTEQILILIHNTDYNRNNLLAAQSLSVITHCIILFIGLGFI